MPRLNYVGPAPTQGTEVLSQRQGIDLINAATINRTGVTTQIESAVATRAGADYIDTADATFATVEYYQGRDALNVPQSAVGTASGVAGLVSGKVPLAQLPVLGSGFIKGPFGPTTVNAVTSATTTPVKLAEFVIGNQSIGFHPMSYALVAVDTTPGGRPIVEMRMSNGAAAYSAQKLIGQGIGRTIYNGRQIVAVTPVWPTLGAASPEPWDVNTNIVASLYVYSSSAVSVQVGSASVLSAAVYLMRMKA